MKASVATEHQEQAALVEWLRRQAIPFFSVPNGARVRWSVANRLRREGMQAGVPDLVLVKLAPVNGKPTAVEMKRERCGVVSHEQATMHELMQVCGWNVLVGRGWHDAVEQLTALGYGRTANARTRGSE